MSYYWADYVPIELTTMLFGGILLVFGGSITHLMMNCAKKRNAHQSGNVNQTAGAENIIGAATAGSAVRLKGGTADPTAVTAAPIGGVGGVEPAAPKAASEDSFKARRPEVKEAKRADEIVERGPVPRRRADYKTMNISTIDFEQSMSKAASNRSATDAPPLKKK